MNLLGKASNEAQQERWREIVERYYREVDESSFDLFVKKQNNDVKWECDYVIMEVSAILADLGVEEGIDALKDLGVRTDSSKKIRQQINGRITNHELKSSPVDSKERPDVDFYETWASIRKEGYNIDENITLPAWVGVLKTIRKQNERNNSKT